MGFSTWCFLSTTTVVVAAHSPFRFSSSATFLTFQRRELERSCSNMRPYCRSKTHTVQAQQPLADDRLQASSSNSCGSSSSERPVFVMGLLADIQYAPIPDGHSYSGQARYYRHALSVAQHAAQHFQESKVDLVINLGDIVDGKCQQAENGDKAVDDVLNALSAYTHGTILHAYGNHCLYNMDRPTLQSKLGIHFVKEPCGELVGYSSHLVPGTTIRFVILDSYDVSVMQRCECTSRKRAEAVQMLQQHNAQNYAIGAENSPDGLEGAKRRFVAFNGAVGSLQLEWLREQLALSRKHGEKVIILSHQPIIPQSSNPVCLMWNFEDVLAVLRNYSDVIVASFAGHAHKGGYCRDDVSGIHFRVFEAVLENPHPHNTYAIIEVYHDRLDILGFGNCESSVFMFDHQPIPEGRAGCTTSRKNG